MTLRQYFIIMAIGAVLCWAAWAVVLINVDPFQDTGVGFSFFYVSLFFALLGTVSLFSFFIRYYFSQADWPLFRLVQKSFHDALIISIVLTALLFLQGQGYLRWWNAGIAAAAIILLIFFKLFNKRQAV